MLKQLYLGLKFSFSYFSILPVSFQEKDDLSQKQVLGAMLFFLPLVGLVLGTMTLGLYQLLLPLNWYGAIVSAVFYMILYGFIHTEAVIDVADALYASHSGKDAYVIIKEPTVGAMGVLYAIGAVLLKVSGIVFLLMHELFFEFLSVLLISRLSLLMLFKLYDFKSSFATLLKEALSKKYLISSFILFIILGTLLKSEFLIFLLIGLSFAYLISFVLKSKLGFVNGDVLGATLEGVEVLMFLLVALLNES